MTIFIRVVATLAAVAATGFYLLMLLLLTYGACYMRDAGCAQGWIARTIATGVYLVVVAIVVAVTRWVLAIVKRRAAAPRGGVL